MGDVNSFQLSRLLHERILGAAFVNDVCIAELHELLKLQSGGDSEQVRYVISLLQGEAQRLNEVALLLVRSRCLMFEY